MKEKNYLDKFNDFIKKIFGEQKKNEGSGEKNNKIANLIIVALVMVLVGLGINIILNSTSKPTMAINNQNIENELKDTGTISSSGYTNETMEYAEKKEEKLTTFLENMDGVGKVALMIHFESGQEKIPAINENGSTSVTDETDNSGGNRQIKNDNNGSTVVMVNKGDKTDALITKVNEPKISGIVINAEGAKDNLVKMRITQAVTTVFNLKPEQVQVYPMK